MIKFIGYNAQYVEIESNLTLDELLATDIEDLSSGDLDALVTYRANMLAQTLYSDLVMSMHTMQTQAELKEYEQSFQPYETEQPKQFNVQSFIDELNGLRGNNGKKE